MPLRIADKQPVLYEQRKQETLAAARAARWHDALALAEDCLSEQPQDWDVANARAVALYRLGRLDEAEDLMRQGIQSAPQPRSFHHNLAYLLLDRGDPLDAAHHTVEALRETPESPEIRQTAERCRHELVRMLRRCRRKGDLIEGADRAHDLREAVAAIDRLMPSAPSAISTASNTKAAELRLSVVMIAKDEEDYLAECLRSVREIADEIVLVDTGSTDRTREIARELGATVVDHAWRDDFAEARNVSLDHATGDWALWIDADERLQPESAASLRDLIRHAPADAGAFMVGIRNYLTAEGKADVFLHRACRLFRLRPDVRFEGRVHEQNTRALEAAGFKTLACDLQIDHLGYTKEMMSARGKHERFITMLLREIEENPQGRYRHFQMFNLGNSYYILGDMENARVWFERSAENSQPQYDYTAMLYVQWATALYRTKRADEALAVCDRAEALAIAHPGVTFARAHALLQLHEFAAAREQFERTLAQGRAQPSLDVGDAGTFTYKALLGLALADLALERFDSCVENSREALRLNPDFADARFTLAHGLRRMGRLPDARAEYERLIAEAPDHEVGRGDYISVLEEMGDYATAAPLLKAAAQKEPENAEVWLHLGTCCDVMGDLDGALDAWTAAHRLLPANAAVSVNLGRAKAALGDHAAALTHYAEALSMDPAYANAYFNAADTAYRLGRYAEAADMLHEGLRLDPASAAGFFVLGNCYAQTQDFNAAAMAYRAALERDPLHEAARTNLAFVEDLPQAA